ncbi:chromate transporter [Mangrovicoccus ximenensis]|uniref:chromate transporter n=1 Tax=Mangrovicoccus ximenensis TaxID=1911570 RepID=UPI000D3862B7|nr:chromate transporter [Mangrovicoccus ximenensis]
MAQYRDLFAAFWRIGLHSFGGPAAQIAVMHRELVEERGWLSEAQFLSSLSFCMLLPGPEAMQLATYAGWRLKGWRGGLIGGGLFVLPGAAVMAALALAYLAWGQLPLVDAMFAGIQAAVVAIVVQAFWRLAKKALTTPGRRALAALSFLGIYAFGLPFPLIVLAAGIIGAAAAPGEARPAPSVTVAHHLAQLRRPAIAHRAAAQLACKDRPHQRRGAVARRIVLGGPVQDLVDLPELVLVAAAGIGGDFLGQRRHLQLVHVGELAAELLQPLFETRHRGPRGPFQPAPHQRIDQHRPDPLLARFLFLPFHACPVLLSACPVIHRRARPVSAAPANVFLFSFLLFSSQPRGFRKKRKLPETFQRIFHFFRRKICGGFHHRCDSSASASWTRFSVALPPG